jgi:tRNA pseudouridine32 synthase / 23S rRNA pseudouridine746 synthase
VGTSGGGAPLLYSDADVLAVSKPEGIATIPERRPTGDSLVESLRNGLGMRLFVIHRLDNAASGVVVFAKNAGAHRCLNDQFAARQVDKTYRVLVHGRVADDAGEIDLPLRAFGSGRMGVDRRRGKPSVSRFRVLWRCDDATLLSVALLTGRRHQIRVHLYATGHPVVGDVRYGDIGRQKTFSRLMLHACRIGFRLPSGGPCTIWAPPPPTYMHLLAQLCPGAGNLDGDGGETLEAGTAMGPNSGVT